MRYRNWPPPIRIRRRERTFWDKFIGWLILILLFIGLVLAGGDPHCYIAKNVGCVVYGYGYEFYGHPGFFKEEV